MQKYVPSCEEEKKFLEEYNPSDYPSISVTVDAVIFGTAMTPSPNYRKSNELQLKVLLVKRTEYPYKDKLALPGGFVLLNETLEDSLKRTIVNKTGLSEVYSEQLYTFGNIDRDPRMRVVSSAYMSLIDAEKAVVKDAEWYDIDDLENLDLAFDHIDIIKEALKRLRNRVNYSDIVFHMMPEEFTIGDLQKVYELILGETLLAPAFRRTIADKIVDTGKMTGNQGHRPSRIFRYNSERA
ncbi:MAG: NUDIX hydrolase [Clostridia bacterium]|nr:NUDIX hydrolase [Clostridia bacterium]